ncbi:mitochondrial carrier [Metschnikowia bicuspidata]|uniref:Mitochondrial carrier n=1 Tax=Metschnikowia bicuspidata TaxID=27322 RepID=A0A4P9ZAI3_9ASCO|nr:mitochondrial carrier [Metschnikowia bicuspidata]
MPSGNELAHAIAGAGGGALSMIVTYPLVTLSTLAQTTQKKKGDAETTDASDSWHSFLCIKGFWRLYSGLDSALYGITLSNFIYYYFYELSSNAFLKAKAATSVSRGRRGLTTMESMITGAVAGALTVIGTNPFWVANTRLMTRSKTEGGKSVSAFRAMVEIAQTDGVGTLFAGVVPALVLVINPIIQYTIFEQLRNAIVASNGAAAFRSTSAFLIGALGKLVATTLTYPYITLKARMHVKKKESAGHEDLSIWQEIRTIVREEGLEGLYRGLSVKLFQSIMTAAFLFYFKEELMTTSLSLVRILNVCRIRKMM